ncbi:MAG: hypothetical protein RR225_03070 [Clostridium sp.]
MEYILEGKDGKLTIGEIVYYEDEADYPNNTSLYATVTSGLFTGAAHIEISMTDFAEFARNAVAIASSAQGRTYVKEAYGDSCIYIEPLKEGDFGISGELFEKSCAMAVRFQFKATQAQLKAFASPLCSDYGQN